MNIFVNWEWKVFLGVEFESGCKNCLSLLKMYLDKKKILQSIKILQEKDSTIKYS